MYHINITKINTNYLNHNYHRYPSVLTIAFSGNNIHDRHSLKLKAQTCCSHCSHHLYKRPVATPAKAQQVDSQWPLETRIKESNMCSFMFLSHSRQDWQNPSQHNKTTANTKCFFSCSTSDRPRSNQLKPSIALSYLMHEADEFTKSTCIASQWPVEATLEEPNMCQKERWT